MFISVSGICFNGREEMISGVTKKFPFFIPDEINLCRITGEFYVLLEHLSTFRRIHNWYRSWIFFKQLNFWTEFSFFPTKSRLVGSLVIWYHRRGIHIIGVWFRDGWPKCSNLDLIRLIFFSILLFNLMFASFNCAFKNVGS